MKIVVIGGGAAGFFSAITAAQYGNQVIILEKSNKVLSKVKISGGGRCNVTNSCSIPSELIKNYPRGGKELLGPFHRFNPEHTVAWFRRNNVDLKTESDGRIFPVSDSSRTIIDCFRSLANKYKIVIKTSASIKDILYKPEGDGIWKIYLQDGELQADRVIFATGSSDSAWNILAELGYEIVPPVPSLFAFNTEQTEFHSVSGVSVPFCCLSIEGTKFTNTGPLLFTHRGISGPVVLGLSSFAARYLYSVNYRCNVIVNWFPEMNSSSLETELLLYRQIHKNKLVSSAPFGSIPERLWKILLLKEFPTDIRWNTLSISKIRSLILLLTAFRFTINGKSINKDEFVTAGGIELKQIDFRTMQSKIHKNLFFAGEVLNIDALTGGFNFQAAWTTGYIAGTSASTQ